MNMKIKALKAAFPYTVPILTGFLVLGIAFGIYMDSSGFSPLFPILSSLLVFAGSMQFVLVELLLGAFDPMGALLLTLMVNARHLFYGISLLEKYNTAGKKRWYMIFGLCDENFSVNCAASVPKGIDHGWFYFFVTLLNHCYWVTGSALGALFGSLLDFNTEGLDFVLTALITVLFLEQWRKKSSRIPALIGVGASLLCLPVFGAQFIIPAMLIILAVMTVLRGPLERREAAA